MSDTSLIWLREVYHLSGGLVGLRVHFINLAEGSVSSVLSNLPGNFDSWLE